MNRDNAIDLAKQDIIDKAEYDFRLRVKAQLEKVVSLSAQLAAAKADLLAMEYVAPKFDDTL